MTLDDFIEMLAEINDLSDLNENNVIERIKTKLEENDLRRWESRGMFKKVCQTEKKVIN